MISGLERSNMKKNKEAFELFINKIRQEFMEEGLTMNDIAEKYDMSRERIRQILRDNFNLSGKDGLARINTKKQHLAERQAADDKFKRKHGMSKAEFKAIKIQHTIVKNGKEINAVYQGFLNQRANAHRSKVAFHLNFAQWWKLWNESGFFDQRGQGKYGLVRKDSNLPFTLENTQVGLSSERASFKMKEWWVKEKSKEAAADNNADNNLVDSDTTIS